MLFSVGGMFSMYEGIHKFQHPEPLKYWWWAVGVLVFAIAAEAVSMRACLQEVDKARGSRGLWQWFRESRQAELVVIFGEDLTALLGLMFALGAVLLTVVTGNPLFDAIGTIAIGVLLIVIAVLVAVEVKSMLIGQSVDPLLQAQIEDFLKGRTEIAELLHLITQQQGEDVLVSIHARMRHGIGWPADAARHQRGRARAEGAVPDGALELLRTRGHGAGSGLSRPASGQVAAIAPGGRRAGLAPLRFRSLATARSSGASPALRGFALQPFQPGRSTGFAERALQERQRRGDLLVQFGAG